MHVWKYTENEWDDWVLSALKWLRWWLRAWLTQLGLGSGTQQLSTRQPQLYFLRENLHHSISTSISGPPVTTGSIVKYSAHTSRISCTSWQCLLYRKCTWNNMCWAHEQRDSKLGTAEPYTQLLQLLIVTGVTEYNSCNMLCRPGHSWPSKNSMNDHKHYLEVAEMNGAKACSCIYCECVCVRTVLTETTQLMCSYFRDSGVKAVERSRQPKSLFSWA
jgi:hypothetical protein